MPPPIEDQIKEIHRILAACEKHYPHLLTT